MPTTKKETPVEGEVVEEVQQTKREVHEYSYKPRKGGAGLFFGAILLIWGLAILSDTYLGTELASNIWPMLAVVFGLYLVVSSFNR